MAWPQGRGLKVSHYRGCPRYDRSTLPALSKAFQEHNVWLVTVRKTL
jgi:hypothetical protein